MTVSRLSTAALRPPVAPGLPASDDPLPAPDRNVRAKGRSQSPTPTPTHSLSPRIPLMNRPYSGNNALTSRNPVPSNPLHTDSADSRGSQNWGQATKQAGTPRRGALGYAHVYTSPRWTDVITGAVSGFCAGPVVLCIASATVTSAPLWVPLLAGCAGGALVGAGIGLAVSSILHW